MKKVIKRTLLVLAVFFVGVVAFYGSHIYLSQQRIKAAKAADPEYQRILQQEREAANSK